MKLAKFPDLNFAPYDLYIYSCYMKPVRDTYSEPGLPVVMWEIQYSSLPFHKTFLKGALSRNISKFKQWDLLLN